jgi:fumarylacetoacetase
MINETHDPALTSWVHSANVPDCDFPIQNLPLGVFRRQGSDEPFRGGVAIGDKVLDLRSCLNVRAFRAPALSFAVELAAQSSLNDLMDCDASVRSGLRLGLSRALRAGATEATMLETCLVEQAACEYRLPATIGDYTDFYTSIYHATAVGRLFRPNNPLLPNYKWVPIGYHGRSSSIVISGTAVLRPMGQTISQEGGPPILSEARRLDFELELGAYVAKSTRLGRPVSIQDAEAHLFGISLLNDWSARDIQSWEYQPLGPFLSKNFATTVSPWIVTREALEPFRAPFSRQANDIQPLSYLDCEEVRQRGAFDIQLEVAITTPEMRRRGLTAQRLCATNFKHAYWTISQMLAHHTVNGCNLNAGDLLGTGTQSGPTPEEAGSLLELTLGGKRTIRLPTGEERVFLEDGDEVVLRGWCESPTARRIGFGEAVGQVVARLPL